MKTCIKLAVIGIGLLIAGSVLGILFTLASLLIRTPVKNASACYSLQSCPGGSATIAAWRGFPFGITESPVAPFEDCDVIDCYPYFHRDSAVIDFVTWTLVSYGLIGIIIIGIRKGEVMEIERMVVLSKEGIGDNQQIGYNNRT